MTPQQLQLALQLAQQHRAAARFSDAEGIYRQILLEDPQNTEALYWLGFVLFRSEQFAESAVVIRQLMTFQPTRADHYGNLCVALTFLKQYDEAIAMARKSIVLKPDYGEGYDSLGRALRLTGRLDQAVAAYRQGIAAEPKFVLNYVHLGEALYAKGQLHEAMAAYRQALVVRPDCAEALFGLGVAHKAVWETDQAIAAYEKAIALRPNYNDALMNLANAQLLVGRIDEACDNFRRCMEIAPNDAYAHSNLILALHYSHGRDPAQIARELASWNQRFAEPLRKFIRPHENDPSPDRRLRIGYLSPDFRDHPVGRFVQPLLANHDHQQFEIFCYSGAKDLDSTTDRIRQSADVWKNVRDLSDAEIAETIRHDRIDILVDLSLHTKEHRLKVFAQKPAPIQVSYLGYCGSSGLSTMDYRFTDRYFDPPGADQSGYTEKSYTLPRTYWVYEPVTRTPEVAPLPAPAAGFVTFGCFNNYCKVSPATWDAWTRILLTVPNSRLMVYAERGRHRDAALKKIAAAGVDPARVTFVDNLPLRLYFPRYHAVDIALDPFPFCGGTTTCDTLLMGVPVVTLRGKTAVGRAGVSILSNLGLPELIADTVDQYVQIAADLAGDLPKLAELRKNLRTRMQSSPLMDAPAFARDIEAAYCQIWRDYCKPPTPSPLP
ncbi:MAG: tetratricopeptide repeat protein [Tepidisphaeraceae bacterium]